MNEVVVERCRAALMLPWLMGLGLLQGVMRGRMRAGDHVIHLYLCSFS